MPNSPVPINTHNIGFLANIYSNVYSLINTNDEVNNINGAKNGKILNTTTLQMGSIIWDLPFSLMLGLKFVSNLIHTPMAEDLKVIKKSIITPTAPIRVLISYISSFYSCHIFGSMVDSQVINRKQDAKYQVIEP